MTSQLGEEASDEETTIAILRKFYANDSREWTKCIAEFNKLITELYTKPIEMDLDFENRPANYYITADTYSKYENFVDLYNHLSGKKETDLSVPFAKRVRDDFFNSVAHFKTKYEWIYNPPMIGKIGKHTEGKALRQEFQEYYGAYSEITYLLACGDALKFDLVNEMKLSEYLALGEYLTRKRAVESVE